jgi:hypothetical protein
VFQLNDGTTKDYATSFSPINPTKFTFPTTPGYEFVGFRVGDSVGDCRIDRFATLYRPIVCSAASSILVSVVSGKSQAVGAGVSQNISFTATDTTSGFCGPTKEY